MQHKHAGGRGSDHSQRAGVHSAPAGHRMGAAAALVVARMAAQSQRRASRPRRPHAGSSTLQGEPTRLPKAQPRPDAASMEWSTVPTTSCSASRRSGAAPFRIAFRFGFVCS
jgi:hypothetical protein